MQHKQAESIPARASIVIVGAGPTGLAAGNLLGMAGIDTLIVERNSTVNTGPRAIAFDDEGLRICQAMGLISALSGHVLPGLRADYISAGRLFASGSPTNLSNGYPLISTFHQPDFENALFAGLSRFASVRVCFRHTVESFEQTDSRVRVNVRTPDGRLLSIECEYLLACNGGKHSLRRNLNIPLTGITYPQQWVVIDCIDDEDIQRLPTATFFCDPERPAVTVTLPHQRRRWEFMLFPHETEEQLLQDERVQALLQQVYGSRLPHMVRSTTYTFHAALARSFSNGRVFLLGDAAHMMPPFGGQGMNSCLRDAHNLAWKLALVLRGLASPAILKSYQQERHDHVMRMIWFSTFLGQVVMTRRRSLATLRDLFFRTLNAIPYSHTYLMEIGFKPQPRIKKGGLLLHCTRASRRYAGRLLPQPTVQIADGQRVLLDEALGNGFALLHLHSDPTRAFSDCTETIWQKLNVRFACIQPVTRAGAMNSAPTSGVQTGAGAMNSAPTSGVRTGAHPASVGALFIAPADGPGEEPILPPHRAPAYTSVEHALENGAPGQPVIVRDIEGTLNAFFRANADLYLLVRPDRYILGAFASRDAGRFATALHNLLEQQ